MFIFLSYFWNISAINTGHNGKKALLSGKVGMVSMIFTAPDTCDAIGWTTPNAQHKCGLPPVGFQSF